MSGASRSRKSKLLSDDDLTQGPPLAGAAHAAASQTQYAIGEIVWAWDAEASLWRRAVVIATDRPTLPSLRDSVNPVDSDREAYIHWKGFDRRLDRWLQCAWLRRLRDVPAGTTNVAWSDEEDIDDAHAGMDQDYLKEHQEHTKFKTINRVQMGRFVVDAWYFSPFPLEVQNSELIYICPFCLAFFKYEVENNRHNMRCTARHPPGNEIYRDTERLLAMWEVDGGVARIYCENLCYLSKLFLDHKTLRHPVHLFLFYILTEMAEDGYHIVGYFSKEKYSRNNVSCILTLPQYQKKGYGKFLINFSYALATTEGRRGTPERPLSDLGKASYLNYWRQVLLHELKGKKDFCIAATADKYAFEPTDILACLEDADILQRLKNASEDPFLYLTPESAQILSAKLGEPAPPTNPDRLHWLPYDPFLGPFEYSADG